MRKLFIGLLSALLIATPVFAYTVRPGDTLWKIADSYGTTVNELATLNQLENPDLIRVGQELTTNNEMLGAINYVQTQYFTLAGSGAVLGATSITLKTFDDISGTNLTMADFGEKGFMTIDPNNGTKEEQITFTGVTQNANGTATLSGVSTVLMKSPYTETSGLAQTHAGGTKVVVSNTAGFYNTFANKYNNETVTGFWVFPTPLSSSSSAPATVGYINGVTANGVATSSESNFGGVWLSTPEQMASSSYNINSPRALYSRYSTSTPGYAGKWIPITESDGKLNQGFIDLNENYTWGGSHTFPTSTITVGAGTITSTPEAYGIPKAGSDKKIAEGWLPQVYNNLIFSSSTDETTITNRTDTVVIASTTIVGGTLGTNNMINFSITVPEFDFIGSSNSFCTTTLTYGTTEIATIYLTNGGSDTFFNGSGVITGSVYAAGSANAQNGMMFFNTVSSTSRVQMGGVGTGSATEDSSLSKNLLVTFKFGNADPLYRLRVKDFFFNTFVR